MTKACSCLFFIVMIIMSPISSKAYYLGTTELRDLESNDANFLNEITSWNPSSLVTAGTRYYVCNSFYLLGGYDILPKNAYFTRSYNLLPTHSMFTFTVNFWLIDSWNSGDHFVLDFDGVPFNGFLGNEHSTFGTTSICGGSNRDLGKVAVSGKVIHTGPTLTITLTNKMDENPDNESFGMRDLKLVFGTANATDVNSFCGSPEVAYKFPNNDCTCSTGKYQEYNPGQCANCNGACKTCYWGSSSDCFTCNTGYYQSGSSCFPCHSYCSKCSGPTADECSACNSPYYLVLGQSCINGCNPPMTPSGSGSNLVCSYNCAANQYIYPSGSCESSCGQYLRPSRRSGLKICEYYCTSPSVYDPVSDTCMVSCPSGYFQDTTYRYCRPCQTSLCAKCPTLSGAKCDECKAGAVLDSDSLCKICDSMTVDYIKSTTTAEKYKVKLSPSTCKLSPSFVAQNLLATDESKAKFPPFSFTTQQIDSTSYFLDIYFQQNVLNDGNLDLKLTYLSDSAPIPKKFIPSETLQALEEVAPTAATVLGGSLGAGFGGAIALGTTAALWSLVGFQQFIGYFIYINIDYPFQVELFLTLLQSTSFSFLPNPLKSVTDYLSDEYSSFKADVYAEKYQPPKKFVKYELTSFFIENGGSTIGIGLGFLLLIAIIPLLLRIRVLTGRSILSRIQATLKWNVASRTFLESGIPLSLAIFLQCRKISFSSFYMIFSVLMSFIAFCYLIAMFHFLFKSLQRTGNYFLELKKVKNSYGTLYEGMSLERGLAKYYHLIILLRGILLMFLITFLEAVPILQIFPLILYNVGLVYYLFRKAGFEDSKLNLINRIKEILILAGEIGVMCLSFRGGSSEYYDILGWLIVGCLSSALLIELGYTLGLQIMILLQIPKKVKEWMNLMRMVINKEALKKKRRLQKGAMEL